MSEAQALSVLWWIFGGSFAVMLAAFGLEHCVTQILRGE